MGTNIVNKVEGMDSGNNLLVRLLTLDKWLKMVLIRLAFTKSHHFFNGPNKKNTLFSNYLTTLVHTLYPTFIYISCSNKYESIKLLFNITESNVAQAKVVWHALTSPESRGGMGHINDPLSQSKSLLAKIVVRELQPRDDCWKVLLKLHFNLSHIQRLIVLGPTNGMDSKHVSQTTVLTPIGG